MPDPTRHEIVSALSPSLSLKRQVRKHSARGRGGIVVTQNRIASEVGARVLKEGGHAVDAAVAAAFTVGVAEPWMSGIGGVGAMLVYEARTGAVTGFDFGGRSPKGLNLRDFKLTTSRDEGNLFGWPMVEGNINTVGAKAVVAPTEPAGLAMAHGRFGKKNWRDLLAPAVALAREGIVVDWHTTLVIAAAMKDLAADPGTRARFLPTGHPPVAPAAVDPRPEMRLPMPDLARTLEAIRVDGAGVLYRGALAEALTADIRAMGGYLTTDDMTAVTPREVSPLVIPYRGRSIHVMPELNGGPTLWVAYKELQSRRPEPEATPGARTFVDYAAALRTAWQDRFERMGDAGRRTAPTSTTHLSVVDREGNMVTLTQTLLSLFGARVVSPSTGILMNNGINWFDPAPGGPNSLAPDRRGLSNYVPSVMVDGEAVMALGGCGGRRIIPAIFQLMALSADFGMDLEQAFHTPRVDVSGLDVVVADRRMPAEVVAALGRAFPTVLAEPVEYPFPYTIAGAVRRRNGENEGATEPYHPWSEAVSEAEV